LILLGRDFVTSTRFARFQRSPDFFNSIGASRSIRPRGEAAKADGSDYVWICAVDARQAVGRIVAIAQRQIPEQLALQDAVTQTALVIL
jgi:hypothetical protein